MSYDSFRTLILAADDAAREGGYASLHADLTLAEALKGQNVKRYVATMTAEGRERDEEGVYVSAVREMFRTPGTWGKVVSQARAVLKRYGNGSADAAIDAIDTLNALRRADRVNGVKAERETWSLASWYATCQKRDHTTPSRKVETTVSAELAETFVTVCDDRAELVKLAEMVAHRLAELDNASVDTSKVYETAA